MPTRHRNAEWTDTILLRYYTELSRLVGTSKLPPLAGRPEAPGFLSFGKGTYGTVYPVPECDVVLKVTFDSSESDFVAAAMTIDRWPVGITRYHGVLGLPERHAAHDYEGPLSLLWREEAVQTGVLVPGPVDDVELAERAGFANWLLEVYVDVAHGAGEIIEDLGATKLLDVDRRREPPRYVQKILGTVRNPGGRKRRLPNPCRGVRQRNPRRRNQAAEEVPLNPTAERILTEIDRVPDPMLRLENQLAVCRHVLELLQQVPDAATVAQAILWYLDEADILMADVHWGNVGQVMRPDEPWAVTVITDPGHSFFLTDRYDQIQIPELPRQAARSARSANRLRSRLLRAP